jgi:hypothetical protein
MCLQAVRRQILAVCPMSLSVLDRQPLTPAELHLIGLTHRSCTPPDSLTTPHDGRVGGAADHSENSTEPQSGSASLDARLTPRSSMLKKAMSSRKGQCTSPWTTTGDSIAAAKGHERRSRSGCGATRGRNPQGISCQATQSAQPATEENHKAWSSAELVKGSHLVIRGDALHALRVCSCKIRATVAYVTCRLVPEAR